MKKNVFMLNRIEKLDRKSWTVAVQDDKPINFRIFMEGEMKTFYVFIKGGRSLTPCGIKLLREKEFKEFTMSMLEELTYTLFDESDFLLVEKIPIGILSFNEYIKEEIERRK